MNNKQDVVKVIVFACLALMFFIIAGNVCHAQEIEKWDTAPDGSVVITYRTITKNSIQLESFKHKQVGSSRKIPECNSVQRKGNLMYLVTQEDNPSIYVVEADPFERLDEVYIVVKPNFNWVK